MTDTTSITVSRGHNDYTVKVKITASYSEGSEGSACDAGGWEVDQCEIILVEPFESGDTTDIVLTEDEINGAMESLGLV